ncbi:cilia- and flagella-associated protein 298-like [Musca vetustissima]|uniref:cilia- and flagella-associated protein 298-like n=1 Tax=Musca vetustissima TaxID=27455 RepID=UPI002AB6C4D4|nr:cilia- and flagella-associated protein 298-like [Musca vetustissima]XP_061398906.1 cilia- and flagella-associated protein 298-like [Musca vetustissima]
MVILHVKRGDDDLFLYETSVNEDTNSVIRDITAIYNGRLKIERICMEMEELASHGTLLPPEMMGLTDEQVEELKLKDVWAEKCIPSGGFIFNKDPIGRRNGQQPKEKMQEVLRKSMSDARSMINKKLVQAKTPLTLKTISEALNLLKGAVTIVYPMQLPPHDTIRMEFSNTEDLTGTQASKEVIEPSKAQLWFAGRLILNDKKLSDFIGRHDKTKVVVKLNRHGEGPPSREPVITDELRKRMMADAYRRQEELKKLELDEDDHYLNSNWADGGHLKRQVHGLENVRFRVG